MACVGKMRETLVRSCPDSEGLHSHSPTAGLLLGDAEDTDLGTDSWLKITGKKKQRSEI